MTQSTNISATASVPKYKYCLTPNLQADMTVGIVVAMGINNEIGEKGTMPWYLPEDLKHFRENTSSSCVIMGRRTFESIGKPLPKRRNIVISANPPISLKDIKGVEWVSSLEEALNLAKQPISLKYEEECREEAKNLGAEFQKINYEKIFIIGGANLFKSALDFANELIITKINASFPNADTFFPNYQQNKCWSLIKAHPHEAHDYMITSGKQPEEFKQVLADCRDNLSYRFEWYKRV